MSRRRPNGRLAPLASKLIVAAVASLIALSLTPVQQAAGLQQVESLDQQGAAPQLPQGHIVGLSASPNSETSSIIESAGSDDLIAAESSQAPSDAQAEHKAFTSGQVLRQEMAASVAPNMFAQQQQQQQPPPQFAPQGAHMGPRMQPGHKFNPFMAAALAGNYGPAQQQMAAAAAAAGHMHGQHMHAQRAMPHPNHPPPMAQRQQMQPPQPQHMHAAQSQQHMQHAFGQQQQHHQVMPPQQNLAVQESSVRHNVVAAPQQADLNSIEAQPASDGQQHQMAVAGGQQQHSAPATAMAAAASSQSTAVVLPTGSSSAVMASTAAAAQQEAWPLQAPDIPKIVNLEVKCEKNLMKVSIEFDRVFNGVIFSKGHFSQGQCVHVSPNSGKQQSYFDISINQCGTQGNTQNGLYGMGGNTGSGTYFENTIVIQHDANVQEVYDQARRLRCTWHDQYEKAVTFRPFPVDMLDVVKADFAGDNVGCWMQIQVGKGPWASEVAGIVKIGQTMTMVLAIKDEENKFDMLVRNCFAHDGKRGPIELVDRSGCITRPKLMSRFTKIKNFGSSATVLSYAHFQAFKFPDSMEVHFQCTIQICRHQCPEQCTGGPGGPPALAGPQGAGESYSESTISGTFNIQPNGQAASTQAADSMHLRKFGAPANVGLTRERRDTLADGDEEAQKQRHNQHTRNWLNGSHSAFHLNTNKPLTQNVGLNRVIQVVSTGDLAFAINKQLPESGALHSEQNFDAEAQAGQLTRFDLTGNQICMSSFNFVVSLVMLALVLLCSSLLAVGLYVRQRSLLAAAGGHKAMQFAAAAHQQRSSSTLNKLLVASHQQQQAVNVHVPSNQICAHNQLFDARQ